MVNLGLGIGIKTKMKIGILGDGAMSNAISHILLKNRHNFEVFSRKHNNITQIGQCDIAFLCIPSGIISEYLDLLQGISVIVSCSKGLSGSEDFFISKLFNESQFCVLAGPNFANEILINAQTITTVASRNIKNLEIITTILQNDHLEIERTNEVVGVEICGIVKNAIAIIMGYESVKTNFWNEKSLILTKCFQELAKILEHFGCRASSGVPVLELSCGIGDIYLTCSTVSSRNFKFGVNFANGLIEKSGTIEGIRSLQFIHALKIEVPILKGFSEKLSK